MNDINTGKKKSFLKPIWNLFKSVKLAVGLICYFVLTAMLATLVPQAKEAAYYTESYSPFLSWLIAITGFNDFFKSFLFIFPAFMFTVNLLVCMLHRLVRELCSKEKKRFGPDVIHLGILILIVGGLITFLTRQEAFFTLSEGEQVKLAGRYLLQLDKFEYIQYPDGRPQSWTSTVTVLENERVVRGAYTLKVNKPLVLGNVKVYQTSYSMEKELELQKEGGDVFSIPTGHPVVSEGDSTLVFSGSSTATGSSESVDFAVYREEGITGSRSFAIGDKIGNFTIRGITVKQLTGLTAVKDAGFLPVLIASLLIGLGLSWTCIQKIGEKNS